MVQSKIRDRKILFLCEDNACLSLIAEAIAKQLRPPQAQVFSAGVSPRAADARTVGALLERGIDTPSSNKGLDGVSVQDIDLIVVLGKLVGPDPVFPSRTRWERWPVSDPRQEPGDALESFHSAIDEIDKRVAGLFLDYWRNAV
jgi:protein-tyrosine-phosphatase